MVEIRNASFFANRFQNYSYILFLHACQKALKGLILFMSYYLITIPIIVMCPTGMDYWYYLWENTCPATGTGETKLLYRTWCNWSFTFFLEVSKRSSRNTPKHEYIGTHPDNVNHLHSFVDMFLEKIKFLSCIQEFLLHYWKTVMRG